MHKEVRITLPKLGESIVSATVVRWFKRVGDRIQLDEPLLEVSTDKVNSEIPSPVTGQLKEICAQIDEELKVGELLAVVATEAPQGGEGLAPPPAVERRAPPQVGAREFYSPALLRLAQEHGVSFEELARISPSGGEGRITKRDLESYLQQRSAVGASRVDFGTSGEGVERLKISGMRKAIAENMVRSFYEAPHATLVTEVDVTEAMGVIQREKESFLATHKVKLTITSFVARAMCRAVQQFPLINSSFDKDAILVKRFVNLGIAVSVDQGLMVPVIKHCHRMNLVDIAKALQEMAGKARTGKLTAEEIADGTITMTNFGMTGALIGIPIIRYPEVAIVGLGAVRKRVAVLEGDQFAVRSMVHVSLTFDHRVLDGMYGCGYLDALKMHLEGDLKLE